MKKFQLIDQWGELVGEVEIHSGPIPRVIVYKHRYFVADAGRYVESVPYVVVND